MLRDSLSQRRQGSRWASRTMACLTAFSLPACTVPPFIFGAPTLQDIRVEGVTAFRQSSLPGPADEALIGEAPAILVMLSSDRSLSSFMQDYLAAIYIMLSLCRDGGVDRSRELNVGPLLASPGHGRISRSEKQTPREDGRYASAFVFRVENRARRVTPYWAFVDHDFRTQADDACFNLHGGSWVYGTPHRSLDFRIPYAMIAQALSRAGQPHAPLP